MHGAGEMIGLEFALAPIGHGNESSPFPIRDTSLAGVDVNAARAGLAAEPIPSGGRE